MIHNYENKPAKHCLDIHSLRWWLRPRLNRLLTEGVKHKKDFQIIKKECISLPWFHLRKYAAIICDARIFWIIWVEIVASVIGIYPKTFILRTLIFILSIPHWIFNTCLIWAIIWRTLSCFWSVLFFTCWNIQ